MSDSVRPVALVTGASGGIGGALAREFARHGHDLVLTARNVAAMAKLAAELDASGAAVTVIPADLGKPGAATDLAGKLATRGIEISVLVNNVGLGAAGRFDRIDASRISEIMQVNIVALTELTRAFVMGMVARGSGRILLVASVAGFQPGPGTAVYSASKAYVLSLGEALACELRGTGVVVSVLCPGMTATNFSATAGEDLTTVGHRMQRIMRADEVAQRGYRGLFAGRRVVITGGLNRVFAMAARFAPHCLSLPVTKLLTLPPTR